MELLNIKKKLRLARRGHKLLKDKRDELMKNFLALMYENKQVREEVETALIEAHNKFILATALMSKEDIESALLIPRTKAEIDYRVRNVVGAQVPALTLAGCEVDPGYSLALTPMELDNALGLYSEVLPKLIKLAEIEQSAEILAAEIEKTRRRVNALEHILIPQLESSVKYIELRLSEMEREKFSSLMRIKELVRGETE
jgi:V/A-type H+-transporting ATPase subunit D